MATIIEMPKLSDTMTTGKILSWLKNEGDAVESGQAIAEVETDKATMELEVFDDGTLLKILAEKDANVPIGAALAILGEPGEDIAELLATIQSQSGEAPLKTKNFKRKETPKTVTSDSSTPQKEAPTSLAPTAEVKEIGGRIRISPVAQRIASERNIDVRRIAGSGPGGRIVRRDVEEYIEKSGGIPSAPPAPVAAMSGEPYEDIPLTSMRAAIANRLPQSLGPIPHFYLEMDIDAAPLLAANRQIKELAGDIRITLTDLILKACAVALRKHPQINSQFAGNAVRRFHTVNIGLAVAGDGHLLVPVIPHCESKTLEQIARDRAALVEKGQKGRLSLEEMSGGTFTISNLGMFGITRFQAVINPPQAAILAVGTIREEAVVRDGQVVPGQRMSLTLSCDHRVFDGAEGAAFMATLKKIMETPAALCL